MNFEIELPDKMILLEMSDYHFFVDFNRFIFRSNLHSNGLVLEVLGIL